jgi:signal transduction histidine kinase
MQLTDGWNKPGGPGEPHDSNDLIDSIGSNDSSSSDNRRTPETLFANTSRIDTEIGNHSGVELVAASDGPARASSRYLPWLETIAPRNRGDQSLEAASAFTPFFLDRPVETLSSLIHDARNMVAAMDLYCDLLEEPGVLSASFRHYAGELRLVGGASRRLLEKLAALDHISGVPKTPALPASSKRGIGSALENLMQDVAERLDLHLSGTHLPDVHVSDDPVLSDQVSGSAHPISLAAANAIPDSLHAGHSHSRKVRSIPSGEQIQDLAADLAANQNLLAAIAGPGVVVDLSASGGHRPLAMAGEDLTRILVNLCRNAVDVMPAGGAIQIELAETPESLLLTFSDNGPGIPESALEAVFSSGFSAHDPRHSRPVHAHGAAPPGWPTQHRGLGLAIVRSLVSAAGGSVWAANRKGTSETGAAVGAVISLEFPLLALTGEPDPH